ncbi:MAG: metallophosphoesterase [Deltaproteobacteria bacterium]|nr:metallophosphoesterase [Deltaproteobacteria bacterium]
MVSDDALRQDRELEQALNEGLLTLLDRFDHDYLGRRLRHQVDHIARFFGAGRPGLHLEELELLFSWVERGMHLLGLAEHAEKNVLELEVSFNRFNLPGLPPAFEGLGVLHLSDLHLDCPISHGKSLSAAIGERVRDLDFDLCVLTGDFRFATRGDYLPAMRELSQLMPFLRCPLGVFGVLGNHDFIEQVPLLEHLGVTMLVNESRAIERGGDTIHLVGVDDPHFYHTDDLRRACVDLPDDAFAIGLVHSPELAGQAARMQRLALYLCGHTHGGQLCLPGGRALYLNARCPRRLCAGRWRVGDLAGYTSRGTGSSGMPARFNCPPEVALHRIYGLQKNNRALDRTLLSGDNWVDSLVGTNATVRLPCHFHLSSQQENWLLPPGSPWAQRTRWSLEAHPPRSI